MLWRGVNLREWIYSIVFQRLAHSRNVIRSLVYYSAQIIIYYSLETGIPLSRSGNLQRILVPLYHIDILVKFWKITLRSSSDSTMLLTYPLINPFYFWNSEHCGLCSFYRKNYGLSNCTSLHFSECIMLRLFESASFRSHCVWVFGWQFNNCV